MQLSMSLFLKVSFWLLVVLLTVLLDGRLNNEAVLISHKPCDLTKLCSYPTNPVTSLLMKVTQYQYVLTIYMCASFLSFFSKICV